MDRTRKVLNVPFLVVTLAAAALLGLAANAWRSHQVSRTADVFLEQAEALERQEEWENAARYLRRYLGLRPETPHKAEILARVARAYERAAKTPWRRERAVGVYYQAIGALAEDAPIDQERRLRTQLLKLLLEQSRFRLGYSGLAEREAILILKPADTAAAWHKVRAGNPNLAGDPPEGELWWADYPQIWVDAEGARLWVITFHGQVKGGTVAGRPFGDPPLQEHFERALKLNPGDIELSVILARIYRDEPQLVVEGKPQLSEEQRAELVDKADGIVNGMVEANPENADALVARSQYRIDYGLPGAKKDLDKAVQYAPENVAVLLAAARLASGEAARMRQAGMPADAVDAEYEKASAFCRRAIEVAPSQEDAYLTLGDVCRAWGKNDQAIEAWRRGLANCDGERIAFHSGLAELLAAQAQWDDAKKHLDAIDAETKRLAPHLTAGSRKRLGSVSNLLRGEWSLRQGRYGEAIPLLRRVTADHEESDAQVARARQAWQLLSAIYSELSQWDLAATAHEEAARLEPEELPPQTKARTLVAAANAWSLAQCPEMAIGHYEEALALDDNPGTWASLTSARFQNQMGRPPEERNWARFDEALTEAKAKRELLAEPWRVTLLEADAVLAKGKAGDQPQQSLREAVELLRQSENAYPDSQALCHTLVLAYEGLGLSADADRAMETFHDLAGGSAAACVLRSRLYSGRDQYDEARKVLEEGAKAAPPSARVGLQIASVQLSLDAGQLETAYRRLLDLHESFPATLRFVSQLAGLALERSDLAEAARWEARLRELEGPAGTHWRYCKARRLLAQARKADDPRLAEARELQTYIQSRRHAWPAGYVLAGMLSERGGRYQRAIAAYQEAIRHGERRVSVYERLIGLLYQKGRFDEARACLAQLQDHVPSSQTLSALDIRVAAQLGDNARALQAARRRVERRGEDPTARIWLGQMLLRNRQAEEAEAEFLEALRLAPDDPRTSNALFSFYVDTRQLDRAREALQRLVENPELSDVERTLALAVGYDLVGDTDLAEAHRRELARLSRDDALVQKRLAALLLGSDPQGAEAALRRVLQLAPEDGEARRNLIHLLAARGGSKEWQEIEQLTEQGRSRGDPSSLDQRLEALLLVHRGGKENLKKAKRLLEQLARDPEQVIPPDHLLLATLYEWEGRLEAADGEYASLVERADPEPAHVIVYVEFLLRHDRMRDADRCLARLDRVLPAWLAWLENVAPDRADAVRRAARLDAARLRARWLDGQGQTPKIKPLVDQLADDLLKDVGDDPDGRAAVYRSLGDLCSAVGQHGEAERWYGLLAGLVPEQYEPLAMAKARRGRLGEAIRICIDAAVSDDSARPAIVMGKVLETGQPTPEDLRLAEPYLSRAVEQHPDNAQLLTLAAYVRFLQNRIDDAIDLYERVLKRTPEDVLVLNNLATLLAERPPRRKDALAYVDRAIAIAGSKAGLLDVKGTILLLDGNPKQAVPLLEEAVSLGSDPRFLFHLAVAYQRTGEPDKARDALAKAHQGNLTGQVLTETDKGLLKELEKRLGG